MSFVYRLYYKIDSQNLVLATALVLIIDFISNWPSCRTEKICSDKQTLLCLTIGTPETISFPFETNGKVMVLGVPILRHFRICMYKVAYQINPYFYFIGALQ